MISHSANSPSKQRKTPQPSSNLTKRVTCKNNDFPTSSPGRTSLTSDTGPSQHTVQDRAPVPGTTYQTCWSHRTCSTEILLENNPGKNFSGCSIISLSLVHTRIYARHPSLLFFLGTVPNQVCTQCPAGPFSAGASSSAGPYIAAIMPNPSFCDFLSLNKALYPHQPQRKPAEHVHPSAHAELGLSIATIMHLPARLLGVLHPVSTSSSHT